MKTITKILFWILVGFLLLYVFPKTVQGEEQTPLYSLGGTTVSFDESSKTTKVTHGVANEFSFTCTPRMVSGSETLPEGGYMNTSSGSISLTTKYLSGISSLTLYYEGEILYEHEDTSTTRFGNHRGTITLYDGILEEGAYEIFFVGYYRIKSGGPCATHTYSTTFYIDHTKPSVGGGSTSLLDCYVPQSTIISFSDAGSSVAHAYVRGPGQTSYVECKNTEYSLLGSSSGLYMFYCVDLAGNESDIVYAFLDEVPPTGTFYLADGTIISSNKTNQAFTFVPKDLESGVSKVVYKRNNGGWNTYLDTKKISSNGTYYFQVYDLAGNKGEYSISLDLTPPYLSYDGDYTISGTWYTRDCFSVCAYDEHPTTIYIRGPKDHFYTKYTEYTLDEEGCYSFYALDSFGNQSEIIEVVLDTTPPVLENPSLMTSIVQTKTTIAYLDETPVSVYVKGPKDKYYQYVGSSLTLTGKNPNGTYYVQAYDETGNESGVSVITLDIPNPTLHVIYLEEQNTKTITWPDTYLVKLGDEQLTSPFVISEEGTYVLEIQDENEASCTQTITLTHAFLATAFNPVTNEVTYTCKSCGCQEKEVHLEYTGAYTIEHIVGSCFEGIYDLYSFDNGEQLKLYNSFENHQEEVTLHEPTCTEDGYTEYRCSICGNIRKTNVIPKLGHMEEVYEQAPTCQKEGVRIVTCSRCHEEVSREVLEQTTHHFESTTHNPTCDEHGYMEEVCTVCGHTQTTKGGDAYGHLYSSEWRDPTCTDAGGIYHTCIICGDEYIENIVLPKGHLYISEVTKETTCEENGELLYFCTICGHTEYTIIHSLGHQYVLDGEQTTSSSLIYKCSLCGESYSTSSLSKTQLAAGTIHFLFDKYSPYIFYILLIVSSVWSAFMGVRYMFFSSGKSIGEKNKMISCYIFGLLLIFIFILIGPLLVDGVASLFG